MAETAIEERAETGACHIDFPRYIFMRDGTGAASKPVPSCAISTFQE